jgi:hypothetical protein
MVYAKRFWIAIILGVICGLLCGVGGITFVEGFSSAEMWSAIFNRAFIGLAIGISAWRLGWFLHGILIGFLGSLAISIFTDFRGFVTVCLLGILWGFLIELFTTVVFKAPMKTGTASTT